ncbi:MAG: hypothetical protein HZB42_11300 [Sphingobacteriales bacterium]|nr:hypothetical protein [Sphingobacteriales bacterium]
MKKNSTPLVDEHLLSFEGIQEAGTDDFFYTRLKGRMQAQEPRQGWSLPVKPVWAISTLGLLLVVNAFMLSQQAKAKKPSTAASSSSLQNFAESYDQTISSAY